MYEEAAERAHKQRLKSQLGLRGLLLPLLESWQLWAVLILSGLSIGYIGGMLDVLVAWLSDLRAGRCTYQFLYNQSVSGEICHEWLTWSEYLNVTSPAGQALLQSFVYVVLAVCFAGSAAVLVQFYAPYAFHTGSEYISSRTTDAPKLTPKSLVVPEIKAILGGFVLDEFLSPWTLLIKALGLALAVASGLSLGKEALREHLQNQSQRRKILAAAATAGVAVAFGSPLGGVLFGLEELDSALFSNEQLMWRAFVTSVVAATTLAYIDPFGIGKLVLFQVTTSQQWREFELVPWLGLGVAGGVLGALLIRLNVQVALFRKNSPFNRQPLLEVIVGAAVTGIVSWPIVFMRDQTSTLVANLFVECDPAKDYHGLCNSARTWENTTLLVLTAALKVVLTAWTFGMNLPAGIFLPTIGIGASLGRCLGMLLQEWHKAYPRAWIFSSCPPEGTCIYPGFYSVVGAAALLGGVTRMTVSLVVIIFELTGALSHVLPIMLAVMTSKFVGDYFGKGIYDTWIAMHGYPYLPPAEFRDQGETAASVMVPVDNIISVNGRQVFASELDDLLATCDYDGFPVLDGECLLGWITRDKLRRALDNILNDVRSAGRQVNLADVTCTFVPNQDGFEREDLSNVLDKAPMQMRKEVPLQVVVTTFQKLAQALLHSSDERVGVVDVGWGSGR
ncbi:hypothetical protein FRB99_006556 [Tulasnella sp. 403]|nr:hypothetical protein FRB99_006556 [Tulasnella sp. 403]